MEAASAEEMPVDGAPGPKDSSGAPEEEVTETVAAFADDEAAPGKSGIGAEEGMVTVEANTPTPGPPAGAGCDEEAEEAGGRRALNPASKAAAVFFAVRVDAFSEFAAPPPTRFATGLDLTLEVQLETTKTNEEAVKSD